MKKVVIICILVAVLACMWSNVVFATFPPPSALSDYGYVGESRIPYIFTTLPEMDYTNVIIELKNMTLDFFRMYRLPTGTKLYYNNEGDIRSQATPDGYYMYVYHASPSQYGAWESPTLEEVNYYLHIGALDEGYKIVYHSQPIYTDSTCTVIAHQGIISNPFGGATVDIITPYEGYIGNSRLYSINVYITILNIQEGFNMTLLSENIELNGEPFGDLYAELISNTFYETNGKATIQLQYEVELPVGENIVSVEYFYDDEMVASDNVGITRVSGFVDVNGDGIDDRTGQPDSSERPTEEIINQVPQKPDEGGILEWLVYVGQLLGYIMEMVLSSIKEFASSAFDGLQTILRLVEPMFSFVEQFFASMPAPILSAIIALVTVSTILGIIKLIRG